MYDPNKHHRRSIRIPGYDYSQPGAYFITIVTYTRQFLFGEITDGTVKLTKLGRIAKAEWKRLPKRFSRIELGPYIVMPNHIHGILILQSDNEYSLSSLPHHERFGAPAPGSIPTVIRSYKSSVTQRCRKILGKTMAPIWQRNYYEHIIRDDKDWKNIQDYIQLNPQRWSQDEENPDP